MTLASVVSAATAALAIVLASGALAAGGAADAPRPIPVHEDPAELEDAVLDATRAFLRSDLVGARAALDRVETGCRRLALDEAVAYPSEIVLFDEAFHKALDVAREFSGRGLDERAFDQLRWIHKSCRTCHEIARRQGIPGTPAPTAPPLKEGQAPRAE